MKDDYGLNCVIKKKKNQKKVAKKKIKIASIFKNS